MKISVFCPTRNRKDMLIRGIDSLIDNAHDVSNVEFVLRFDRDDKETINQVVEHYDARRIGSKVISNDFTWGKSRFKVIETRTKKLDILMKFVVGKRHGYGFINRYNDESMFISEGEYLLHWTDDFELMSSSKYSGWDELIREGKGQNYIFFFRDAARSGKPAVGPIGIPRKWFEINGRLCPNVLDDWWYPEICKVLDPDTRVVLDWNMRHHNVLNTPNADKTCKEGRTVFDKERERNLKGYEYYNVDEMMKIKEYIDKHPNTKKTSQDHDGSFSGQPFWKKVGASGRWG